MPFEPLAIGAVASPPSVIPDPPAVRAIPMTPTRISPLGRVLVASVVPHPLCQERCVHVQNTGSRRGDRGRQLGCRSLRLPGTESDPGEGTNGRSATWSAARWRGVRQPQRDRARQPQEGAELDVGSRPIVGEDDRLKAGHRPRHRVKVLGGRKKPGCGTGELGEGKPVTIGADDTYGALARWSSTRCAGCR